MKRIEITTGNIVCYEYDRIIKKYPEFVNWFAGKTGMIGDKGMLLIYKDDYKKFMWGRRRKNK